jgi:phosphocarrier protein HPr
MDSGITTRESVLVRQEVKIINELGLHARPAAEFVRVTNAFRSEIWIIKDGKRFSATRIIEVLTADLDCGDTATIEAEGPDATEAVARLVKLVRDFGEQDWGVTWQRLENEEDDDQHS